MRSRCDFFSGWITGSDINLNQWHVSYRKGARQGGDKAYLGQHVDATKFLKGFEVGLKSRECRERRNGKRKKYTGLSAEDHSQQNKFGT